MLGSLHKQWPGGHCKSGLSDLAGAESGCWGSLNHVRRGMQSQRSFRVKYMCQMYVGATPHASCRGTSVPGRCESCHVPTVNDKSCLPSYPGYFYTFFFNSTSGSAIHHKIVQLLMSCEENIFKQNTFCVKIVILVSHNCKIN